MHWLAPIGMISQAWAFVNQRSAQQGIVRDGVAEALWPAGVAARI